MILERKKNFASNERFIIVGNFDSNARKIKLVLKYSLENKNKRSNNNWIQDRWPRLRYIIDLKHIYIE